MYYDCLGILKLVYNSLGMLLLKLVYNGFGLFEHDIQFWIVDLETPRSSLFSLLMLSHLPFYYGL